MSGDDSASHSVASDARTSQVGASSDQDRGRPHVRRRQLLSGIAGILGAVPTAGCARLESLRPSQRRTVTPVPVPTSDFNSSVIDGSKESTVCPELPADAEVYICSPTANSDHAFQLHSDPTAYELPVVELELTFRNRTDFAFQTGSDWWTVARRTNNDWMIVDQGDGAGRAAVGPGETVSWTVSLDTESSSESVDEALEAGQYALSLTGYVLGGELTAVIAPFRIIDKSD